MKARVREFATEMRSDLPLYIAEAQFRYNNRTNDNIFEAAIARC